MKSYRSAPHGLWVCSLVSILWTLCLLVDQHPMDFGFACWSASHELWVCFLVSISWTWCCLLACISWSAGLLIETGMICCGRLAMHLDGCVLKSNIETGLSGLWHAACYAIDVTWQCNLVSCRQHCMQHAKQCRLQVNMPCN